ncbi:MAG: hypothetical protein WCG45_04910 [bacterium]
MKRIIRKKQLSLKEAQKYNVIRENIAKELPELIERHQNKKGQKNAIL